MKGATGILAPLLLLLAVDFGGTQFSVPIEELDIRLEDDSAPNEGRVLIRWSPRASAWTAVCFQADTAGTVAYQMCRRLGYAFACGYERAGKQRTANASLEGLTSVGYRTNCTNTPIIVPDGGCFATLTPIPGSRCTHEEDMWISCGYAGMPDFELRLVEGAYGENRNLLQGRCSPEHEWSAICANRFYRLRAGQVACRELGQSDRAIKVETVLVDEIYAHHAANYTLFGDIGCVGTESTITECEHYSLRECRYYATLECYTSTRKYDQAAYLCGSKQLCGDQCDQEHPIPGSFDDEFHYCQCDDACSLFDDCCYDFADSCGPEQPSLSRGGFTTDQFGCVWVPGSQFTHTGYVAVSRCPISWTDGGTRDLCERPVNVTDVIGSLVVYDEEGVDFKNIYCAICNGRSLDRLERWEVSGSDNNRNPTELRFHPSLNRILPTKGWFITPPQGHAVVRKCPAHLVDTCQDEFRETQLEKACRAYYAPVKLEDSDTRYRNPHCAMCNGRTVVPENSCMDQVCPETCEPWPWGTCLSICSPYDDFFTIEVLFDLSSSSSPYSGASCSEGQIYDPFLEICRVLNCRSGYRIKGNECVVAFQAPLTFADEHSGYLTECLSEISEKEMGRNVFVTGQIHAVMDDDTPFISVSVLVNSADEASDIETVFDRAIDRLRNDSLCNVSSLSIYLPFTFNGSSACTNHTVDGMGIFPGYNGTLLSVLKLQDIPDDQKYSKLKASTVCLKIGALKCSSLLLLAKSEYRVLSEESIQIVATGASLSAVEYVLFPNGKAAVCSFIGPVPEGLEPQIRRAISFAGSLLSLVALAATFVTYSALPELRNVAGKSTINLVVALFTGILLFLLSGFLRQNHGACVSGAVVAHFTWLAAFCWMTLLSFSVARTMMTSMSSRRERTRAFIGYMCLAWGIPLSIVGVCLILQFCNCTNLPVIYGEGAICWITDATARLAAFVLPVAISLVLNIFFYVIAAISFRRSRQNSQVARQQGKMEAAAEEFTIYLKLCALVGVTWVFGFLTQSVTGLLAFSYIYIILNYLQGVFIFVAFCLNKRVRGMWRKKLGIKRQRNTRSNASSDPKPFTRDTSSTLAITNMTNAITEDTWL